MNRMKLKVPLEPRAVDQVQETISLLAENGDTAALLRAHDSLARQSDRHRLKRPRDAATLDMLGSLAAESAKDILDLNGLSSPKD